MKATLIDAGLIILILVGTAGAEGPGYLADPLQLIAEDTAASKPVPRYTPIPASRKAPAIPQSSVDSKQPALPKPAEVDFDSLPSKTGLTDAAAPSKVTPADANSHTRGRLVAAPGNLAPPSIEYNGMPNIAPPFEPAVTSAPSAPVIEPAPAVIAPAVAAPATTIVGTAPEPGYAYQPLVPVVGTPSSIHLGRGIFGQPTVYVPGQPVRNFLRYFSP